MKYISKETMQKEAKQSKQERANEEKNPEQYKTNAGVNYKELMHNALTFIKDNRKELIKLAIFGVIAWFVIQLLANMDSLKSGIEQGLTP